MPDINEIKRYVDSSFSSFGVNKKREISRLIYEIAKRQNFCFSSVLKDLRARDFSSIKEILLQRRYLNSYREGKDNRFYLPKLKINPENKVKIKKLALYPRNIYFEEAVRESAIVYRLKELFPAAHFKRISSLKDYLKCRTFSLKDYNQRQDNFFIVKERYDFLKKCPCTRGAVSCGYYILNIGFGCVYECTYCYLQEYQNSPGIIVPANPDDFFLSLMIKKNKPGVFAFTRIGSGEFTDSLCLDWITGFSPQIIDFFKKHPKIFFEFKTKSNNIQNILKSKPQKNIVISWSVNPKKVIVENEFYTAALKERIAAASVCVGVGFKVGFHFDPVIYYAGWQKDYEETVNFIFDRIKENYIAWISLGTLRFNPCLKKIIENRFPENKILDEELILGFDGKMRYPDYLRIRIYREMLGWIRKRSKKPLVYLCMEEKKIWKQMDW
jgi:spore photoproduct lyase